jgi:hypothetical protein
MRYFIGKAVGLIAKQVRKQVGDKLRQTAGQLQVEIEKIISIAKMKVF